MELITRVLAGVIAAWIPLDGGEERRQRHEGVRAESFDGRAVVSSRKIVVTKTAAEIRDNKSDH
jgi:hypothetical protein